jgi:multidrug efflux pump subunit AcrA (membrane-fusion protein)
LPEQPDGKSPFRLSKAPISPKTQAEYLQLRTGDEIELCIERANEYGSGQEKAGKPVRYGALYRKAITEGWHQEKVRQKAQEDTARKQAEASRQQAAEAKRAEIEKARRSEMERELAAEWFFALPDDEKETLGSAFVAESNPVDVGLFKRKGYDCTGFRFFIKRKWLESEKPME